MGVLLAGVVLARHVDEARVYDLPAARQQPRLGEVGVEQLEQVARAILAQALLEVPDRVLVGHLAAALQPQELLEAAPVEDLELRLLLTQVVVALQHDDLEHEHRVVGRAAEALVAARQLDPLAEELPVDHPVELGQRPAETRVLLVALHLLE